MPISDWFKAREGRRYTVTSAVKPEGRLRDGAWVKCPSCKHTLYSGDLEANLQVCPHCDHHFALTAPVRVASVTDEGTFEETNAGLSSADPLEFRATKSYPESLSGARERTGLTEAVVTGRGTLVGHPVAVGVMDSRFIGASMGSAVGEKIARLFEMAAEEKRSVVMVISSGGARMQEGMLSLMQMAKTAAAVERFTATGLPYIAVLTNPTLGGVTASFATLADVILAEPGALIGFTGPRVIEQTIKQSLPRGFQSAEFLADHGMIDAVVSRGELGETLALLLDYLAGVADGIDSSARRKAVLTEEAPA